MSGLKLVIFILIPLSLISCALHKIDESPESELPEYSRYTDPPEQTSAVEEKWWTVFNDDTLDSIMDVALKDNYEISIFASRYRQAVALTKQARAIRLPQVQGEAAQTLRQDGDDFRAITDLGGALAWEVDLFNRLGYNERAFESDARASLEDLQALRLSLSAEIADTYYSAIEEKLKLLLLQDQEERDRLLLELTELRFAQGSASAVDILQQKSQLEDTVSFIPVSEAALRVFENRLDVLLGTVPDGADITSDGSEFPILQNPPAIGIPSELLLNRPDLRALKDRLIAADNRIGEAIADRLPNISLTGSYFYRAGSSDPTSPVGILLGTLIQPLLDWGLREAEVTRNKELYQERLAEFAQLYITAIEDVESSIYLERKQKELLAVLKSRREVLQQTANETRNRYIQGLTDYLPVLTAVQELRQIDRDIITQERVLITYRIRLFRAIGAPVGYDEGLGIALSGTEE